MKKLIIATIVSAFLASPALGNNFAAEQSKELGKIIEKMDKMKNDPATMDFLTQKRNCIEKATNIEKLQECSAQFPSKKMNPGTK